MKWSLAISRQFTRRRFYTVMCVCVLETTTRRSSSSSLLEMLAPTDAAAPTLSPLSQHFLKPSSVSPLSICAQ